MSETAQAFQWSIATIRADSALMAAATGGVWQGAADSGTPPPVVIVDQQVAADRLTMNAVRLFTDILLQIKAIGPVSNYGALVTIADRIDALFKRVGPVGLASGGVLSCYREQSLSYNEIIGGVAWAHLGGLYRVQLQGF